MQGLAVGDNVAAISERFADQGVRFLPGPRSGRQERRYVRVTSSADGGRITRRPGPGLPDQREKRDKPLW